MTRETKIGLLVGLAFIIVIGILLSDHLTSTNEPQQAQLAQAGGNVRSGVTVPGGAAAPITTVVTPRNVAPGQAVPTREELAPRQPAVEIVKIGPGAAPQQPQIAIRAGQPAQQSQVAIAQSPAEQGAVQNPPPITRESDMSNSSLASVAKTLGEELVPAGDAAAARSGAAQPTLIAAGPSVNGARQYKAEPGDSVSRMASRLMGSNSQANINAIINANATLKANPNLVVAGRTYTIPASASAPAAVAPAAIVTVNAPPPPVVIAETPTAPAPVAHVAASSPEYFYTVKEGDNLSKIALIQLGDSGAITAIKDLNKDALKGGDTIRPNMKLRLPAKPIASAQ